MGCRGSGTQQGGSILEADLDCPTPPSPFFRAGLPASPVPQGGRSRSYPASGWLELSASLSVTQLYTVRFVGLHAANVCVWCVLTQHKARRVYQPCWSAAGLGDGSGYWCPRGLGLLDTEGQLL
jgi:hypothetical protein